MAEVEFGDVKVSGGKLLLIIPLLGSIAGALWGGFELYQRLLDAEEAVTNYVAPDMSGINQKLGNRPRSRSRDERLRPRPIR